MASSLGLSAMTRVPLNPACRAVSSIRWLPTSRGTVFIQSGLSSIASRVHYPLAASDGNYIKLALFMVLFQVTGINFRANPLVNIHLIHRCTALAQGIRQQFTPPSPRKIRIRRPIKLLGLRQRQKIFTGKPRCRNPLRRQTVLLQGTGSLFTNCSQRQVLQYTVVVAHPATSSQTATALALINNAVS